MTKTHLLTKGVVMTLVLSYVLVPLSTFSTMTRNRVDEASAHLQKYSSNLLIKKQSILFDVYMSKGDKGQKFGNSASYSTNKNPVVKNGQRLNFFGFDDVLFFAALIEVEYAVGYLSAKEAHERGGLTPEDYKRNKWCWRLGISAAAGIPTAIGFDHYFHED